MNGITDIECGECGEDSHYAEVKDGKIHLPAGWIWQEINCNWGKGKTLRPYCPACQEYFGQ